MLNKILIRNFQCHERLSIDLDPILTTLVGASDTGKSSVLRSLRWLFANRPLGVSIQRDGSDRTVVKADVDGHLVKRHRSKDKNVYMIGDQEFAAVGTDVPEAIAHILNIGPESYQGQHDPPFWISLTAGELGRRLNEIMDLQSMDRVASALASKMRRIKAELDVVSDREEEAKNGFESLDYVPSMDKRLCTLEDQDESIRGMEYRLSAIRVAVEKITRKEGERKRANAKYDRSCKALRSGVEWLEKSDRLCSILRVVERAEHVQKLVSIHIPDTVALCDLEDRIRCGEQEADGLRGIIRCGEKLQRRISDSENRLQQAKGKLSEFETCPLCGGKI